MAYRGADPTDVMGRRIGAYLLDGLVTMVIMAVILVPTVLSSFEEAPAGTLRCPVPGEPRVTGEPTFCSESGGTVRYLPAGEAESLQTFGVVTSLGSSLLLNVLLQGLTGATIGKLIVGLRVVNAKGQNAGIGRCLIRTVLLIVDSAFCAIIGLVTAFNSKGHKRVGDMVAGTIVIGRDDRDALLLARSGVALPDRKTLAAEAYVPTSQDLTPVGSSADLVTGRPGVDEPVWDDDRDTFIQYDPARSAWMQWNVAANEWEPISQ